MTIRVEVRFLQSWDQPIIVDHPDINKAREIAKLIVDTIWEKFRHPARATIGDNPDPQKWGEPDGVNCQIVYSRGT